MDTPLFIGRNRIELDETESTNLFLSAMLSGQELPEGTVVVAHAQTAGRGQRGTQWNSQPGRNLTVSYFLRPAFLAAGRQFGLSEAVSLAVADTVKELVPGMKDEVAVKWPNDIYIGQKKVAGILIENSVAAGHLSHSIVGIGLNVNQARFPDDLPHAISLFQLTGIPLDTGRVLDVLSEKLEVRYLQLQSRPEQQHEDYLTHLFRRNIWTNYRIKGEVHQACLTGVSEEGFLLLTNREGRESRYDLKEIEFIV